MLVREVNIPATFMFHPPPSEAAEEVEKKRRRSVVRTSMYKIMLMRKAHDVAWNKLKTAQKVMKRDYDVRVRGKLFTVGDLLY